jgi:hypothetical protein
MTQLIWGITPLLWGIFIGVIAFVSGFFVGCWIQKWSRL